MQTYTPHTHKKNIFKVKRNRFLNTSKYNKAPPPRPRCPYKKSSVWPANIYFIQVLIQTIKATRSEVKAKNENYHNIKKKFA